MEYILFSNIVEENGLTIRENRSQIPHNIPIGTLVLVRWSDFNPNGSCSRIEARWFVTAHNRDCDGSPLYSVAPRPIEDWLQFGSGRDDLLTRIVNEEKHGFTEENLTVVEITDEMRKGNDRLKWPDDE